MTTLARGAPAEAALPLGMRRGVAVWAALVAAAVAAGVPLVKSGVGLDAAPFAGRWDVRLEPGLLVAVLVAAGVVWAGPRLAGRLPWRRLMAATAAATAAWATALASSDGWDRLTAPLTTRYEYEPYASTIDSARHFVAGFVAASPDLPTHVKSHPPGATLLPWALDRIGLGGAGWFAALIILSWAVAGVAVLHAVRSVLGEDKARQAAPMLVLLPAAVWAATSADALFTAVLAAGIAVAVAGGRRAALLGGLLLGAALLITYGGVLLLAIPAAVAWHRRRPADLAATLAGVVLVVLAARVAGFWWLDGLEAARAEYWDGVASVRPGLYLTVLGNPAALAAAIGPGVTAGLLRRPGLLAGAALAAVLVADLSQLSRGEVERIWLPFVPWLALAAPTSRSWLMAQAATAVALQAVLRSPW